MLSHKWDFLINPQPPIYRLREHCGKGGGQKECKCLRMGKHAGNAVFCTWLFIRELKAVVGPYRVPTGNLCKINAVHKFQQ